MSGILSVFNIFLSMALPLKSSFLLCFYDVQYRWSKRSTNRGVVVSIELNEKPDGQMIVVECPRVFRDDMVEDIIEQGRELGWTPEVSAPPLHGRFTKRGLSIKENQSE